MNDKKINIHKGIKEFIIKVMAGLVIITSPLCIFCFWEKLIFDNKGDMSFFIQAESDMHGSYDQSDMNKQSDSGLFDTDSGFVDGDSGLINVDVSEKELEARLKDRLVSLKNINDDVRGIVYIPDSDFCYFVMQSDSPDYYLNRNINGNFSYYGTPYIADGFGVDGNVLIYGHCINYHEAFGRLLRFKNKEYFDNHKRIIFVYYSTDNKHIIISEYDISTVLSLNIYRDDFRYWDMDYDAGEGLDDIRACMFNNAIEKWGLLSDGCKLLSGDRVLMLSTCDNEKGDGYRLVIIWKKKIDTICGGVINYRKEE